MYYFQTHNHLDRIHWFQLFYQKLFPLWWDKNLKQNKIDTFKLKIGKIDFLEKCLPSVNEIIILRWNASLTEQYGDELFPLISVVVKKKKEGGKRKRRLVWNIESRFDGILYNVDFFKIELKWSIILSILILFISPWRWRTDVVNGTTREREKNRLILAVNRRRKILFLLRLLFLSASFPLSALEIYSLI